MRHAQTSGAWGEDCLSYSVICGGLNVLAREEDIIEVRNNNQYPAMNTLTVCCLLVCLSLPLARCCNNEDKLSDTRPQKCDVCSNLTTGLDEISMHLEHIHNKVSTCEPCAPSLVRINIGYEVVFCPAETVVVSCRCRREDVPCFFFRFYETCSSTDTEVIFECDAVDQGALEIVYETGSNPLATCPKGTQVDECALSPMGDTTGRNKTTLQAEVNVTANSCQLSGDIGEEIYFLTAICWQK